MDNSIILKNLISLIEDLMEEFPFPIVSSTMIEKDLEITGDDAFELIIEYGKRFNVDVSKFKIVDYFREEGGIDISYYFKKKERKKELTIGDLIAGIKAGRLDDEVIEASKAK